MLQGESSSFSSTTVVCSIALYSYVELYLHSYETIINATRAMCKPAAVSPYR